MTRLTTLGDLEGKTLGELSNKTLGEIAGIEANKTDVISDGINAMNKKLNEYSRVMETLLTGHYEEVGILIDNVECSDSFIKGYLESGVMEDIISEYNLQADECAIADIEVKEVSRFMTDEEKVNIQICIDYYTIDHADNRDAQICQFVIENININEMEELYKQCRETDEESELEKFHKSLV